MSRRTWHRVGPIVTMFFATQEGVSGVFALPEDSVAIHEALLAVGYESTLVELDATLVDDLAGILAAVGVDLRLLQIEKAQSWTPPSSQCPPAVLPSVVVDVQECRRFE